MRYVTYRVNTHSPVRAGVIQDDMVIDLEAASAFDAYCKRLQPATDSQYYVLEEVTILSPVPDPPSVRDAYAFEAHIKAARALRGLDMEPAFYQIPTFYFSNPAATVGPYEAIMPPPATQELDYELELALVIGKEGRDISVEHAWEYVAGITIMNDWSARDLQRLEMKLNLGPAKGKDFATSLGPCLVTIDELMERVHHDRFDLQMIARINGRELSRGNAKDMYWSFPQIIEYTSRGTVLRPGDVIGSGTVGTGCILELRPETTGGWLKAGDVVELEVERLGVLRNVIAGASTEPSHPIATDFA